MSDEPEVKAAANPLGVGTPAFFYVMMCGCSVALLVLLHMSRGASPMFVALVMLVGAMGLLTRMRYAPLLLVLLVAGPPIVRNVMGSDYLGRFVPVRDANLPLADVMVAAAVLGFVAGHYRLQGLKRYIFPPDQRLLASRKIRLPKGWQPPTVERKRSPASITTLEQVLLALSLPAFALAGQQVWQFVAAPRQLLEWEEWIVRMTVLIVLLAPGLMIAAGLLRAWRRTRLTVPEARLLMQDSLWRETRGEHRYLTRWLAWFWLQQQERKEGPRS